MPDHIGGAARSRVLLTTDAVGGVWSYTIELARGMAERGIRPLIAVLGPAPDQGRAEEARRIPGLTLLPTGLPLDWTAREPAEIDEAAQDLAALAEDLGADTVHLHTPAFAAACFAQPVIAAMHSCVRTWWRALRGGPLPDELAWRAARVARGMSLADAVIAPSGAFARAVHDAYDATPGIQVVHNGRRPVTHRVTARRRTVLMAGRLWDEAKGAALLDHVAGRLDAPVLAAGSVAAPDGGTAPLRSLRVLGSLDETALADEMARCGVFASPARYEPFGLSVLEAAQCGAPLVLSDIPSFRELWDGAAQFLPPGDPGAWETALRSLLDDAPRLAALSEAAQRRSARYGAEEMVERTLSVHREALAARQAVAV